jgi:hypothetical protein
MLEDPEAVTSIIEALVAAVDAGAPDAAVGS